MPSARPGNTADTAWAVLPPARAPGTDPRSPTRQAVRGCLFLARLLAAPSDHADSHGAAAGSRGTLAGQRLEKSSRLPRASSETRARSVPMSAAMSCASHFSESREFGAELLLERDPGQCAPRATFARFGARRAHGSHASLSGEFRSELGEGGVSKREPVAILPRQYRQYCQVARRHPASPSSRDDTVHAALRATILYMPCARRHRICRTHGAKTDRTPATPARPCRTARTPARPAPRP